MALSHRVRAYLALERAMLDLDAEDDPAADDLRDAMDPLWYHLSAEERAWLDARVVGPSRSPAMRTLGIPVGSLPEEPGAAVERIRLVQQPGLAA